MVTQLVRLASCGMAMAVWRSHALLVLTTMGPSASVTRSSIGASLGSILMESGACISKLNALQGLFGILTNAYLMGR